MKHAPSRRNVAPCACMMRTSPLSARLLSLLSLLLCLLAAASLASLPLRPAGAAEAPETTLSVTTVRAEPGDTVQISILVGKSKGVCGFGIALDYPGILEFDKDSFSNNGYFPDYKGNSPKYSATNTEGKCGYPVLFQCTLDPSYPNITEACTLVTAELKVSTSAKEGAYPLTPHIDCPGGCLYRMESSGKSVDVLTSIKPGYLLIGDASLPVDPDPIPSDSSGTEEPSDSGSTVLPPDKDSDGVDHTSPDTSETLPPDKDSDIPVDPDDQTSDAETSDAASNLPAPPDSGDLHPADSGSVGGGSVGGDGGSGNDRSSGNVPLPPDDIPSPSPVEPVDPVVPNGSDLPSNSSGDLSGKDKDSDHSSDNPSSGGADGTVEPGRDPQEPALPSTSTQNSEDTVEKDGKGSLLGTVFTVLGILLGVILLGVLLCLLLYRKNPKFKAFVSRFKNIKHKK